jgi:hypothetical protein
MKLLIAKSVFLIIAFVNKISNPYFSGVFYSALAQPTAVKLYYFIILM